MKSDLSVNRNEFFKVIEVLLDATLRGAYWQDLIAVLSKNALIRKTHMFGIDTQTKLTLNMIGCGCANEATDPNIPVFAQNIVRRIRCEFADLVVHQNVGQDDKS